MMGVMGPSARAWMRLDAEMWTPCAQRAVYLRLFLHGTADDVDAAAASVDIAFQEHGS